MLKYSFMSRYSNCTKEDAVNFLRTTNKPIKYTYGFEYKHPTTHKVPIDAETAIQNMNKHWTDVTEYEDYVHVNSYSDNDMW